MTESTIEKVVNTEKPVLAEGTRVKVIKSSGDEWLIGRVLPIVRTDVNDPALSYLVDASREERPNGAVCPEGTHFWVYEVTEVVPQTDAEAQAVTVESPFAIGTIVQAQSYPCIVGTLMHVDPENRAYVVGRENADQPWAVHRRLIDQFETHTDLEVPGGLPDVAAFGMAIAALQTNLQAQVEEFRLARNHSEQAHEAFREQVRDVAIRVAEEQSWCDNGLNEVLEELGLERKTCEYEVTVSLRATQTVTVTVEASSEDDAREQVENDSDLIDGSIDRHDWEWEIDDITDVEAQ